MDRMAQLYELWKSQGVAGDNLAFWQEFYVKFYQAFIEADRWKQYLEGVGTTLLVTAMALAIGVLLGVLVAMVRTAHDQQRPGRHNPLLAILNAICKIYVTVIRGTPMMVQLLIMGLVIFSSSRNFTMVGALTLGINSGAYVAEIIRGGLMSLDAGQSEAGRSLGLNYLDTMRFIVVPQAFKTVLPALGNEFIILLKDTSLITVAIGVLLGVLVAMVRTAHDQQRPGRHNPLLAILNAICKIYVTVIRGTPMMVQLLIMGLVIFSSSRNFTMVGALTLGINSGAYVAEIIRGGLMSLDAGQSEAGRSLGLNYLDTMRFIVVPQAFKTVLPALGNEFIILLKDTSLITVIGGKELLYAAQGIYNRTWEQMYPLLGTAAIYLVLVILFSWLQGKLERRLRQSDRH